MYLINDLIDQEKDRLHFSKKNRPIAAGRLRTGNVLLVAIVLITISLMAAYQISYYLLAIIASYIIVQLFYSLWLKNIMILDILVIAFTFMLRIFAGSIVVLTPLSAWLILTTMMLALFLGVGKRRSELTLLSGQTAVKHRRSLIFYPAVLLDALAIMMATSTLLTYSLFTFNAPETVQREFFTSFFPQTLASPKLLMATIPIVVYGIFRYLYLVFEKSEGESPERILLSDKPLFISVASWLVLVISTLYFFSL